MAQENRNHGTDSKKIELDQDNTFEIDCAGTYQLHRDEKNPEKSYVVRIPQVSDPDLDLQEMFRVLIDPRLEKSMQLRLQNLSRTGLKAHRPKIVKLSQQVKRRGATDPYVVLELHELEAKSFRHTTGNALNKHVLGAHVVKIPKISGPGKL